MLLSHFIKLPGVELIGHWTLSGFSIPWGVARGSGSPFPTYTRSRKYQGSRYAFARAGPGFQNVMPVENVFRPMYQERVVATWKILLRLTRVRMGTIPIQQPEMSAWLS